MIKVSSKEFRDKQKSYLDRVDDGIEILVQRGKHKSYKIVPVIEDDRGIDKDYILAPDEDLARAITFDELLVGVKEDLREIFARGKK
ncbi:MAG: prevent-host-death protein [Candidatus Azobacteroides sp.]|nr:prevent-host-death protein [Candidatus Azobacteroides sp.]